MRQALSSVSTKSLHDLISGRGFDAYQAGLRARFRAMALGYTLTYCEPTDNPAMRLDFETSDQVGRVTVWESGACEMEVLNTASSETVFCEHHDFLGEQQFLETYSRLVVFMSDAQQSTRRA